MHSPMNPIMPKTDFPPLIVHVIYSLGVGGLENGLVNLINGIPEANFRHAIVCIKHSTDFSRRLKRKDVEVYELNKKEGHDWRSFVKMYHLLRRLKPAIVHTRNLAAIEYQVPALLAGVKYRIHGEHGWDVFDPEGNNKKYQKLRKFLSLIVHRFIPLSMQLQSYLENKVGISSDKILRICNGVDMKRFYPAETKEPLLNCPFLPDNDYVYIGTVGRMHGVKDQMTLIKAFIRMIETQPQIAKIARLILIGDGPIRRQALELLQDKKLEDLVWMPGERNDIAEIMRYLDIFVLPSTAEGISNTVLEAMATGLPVVATRVGGNPELVVHGETGHLVEKEDYHAMADVILDYLNDSKKRRLHGRKGYQRASREFSIDLMIDKYMGVYNSLLNNR